MFDGIHVDWRSQMSRFATIALMNSFISCMYKVFKDICGLWSEKFLILCENRCGHTRAEKMKKRKNCVLLSQITNRNAENTYKLRRRITYEMVLKPANNSEDNGLDHDSGMTGEKNTFLSRSKT